MISINIPKATNVNCNKCKKTFALAYTQREYNDNIIEMGFQCPHCSKFYHSYYLTPELMLMQQELTTLRREKTLSRVHKTRYKKVLYRYKRTFDKVQKGVQNT